VKVEVAYARPDRQQILEVTVPEGTSAMEAIRMSGITDVFAEIELETISVGVFGKVIKSPGTHALQDGDRVELYRPLKIDPKEARLNRARKKDKDQ
jgi:putative ubiquitin-RnfH superfamily antitoxin RatB of RatAB toxin-antitoxin module